MEYIKPSNTEKWLKEVFRSIPFGSNSAVFESITQNSMIFIGRCGLQRLRTYTYIRECYKNRISKVMFL